MRYKRSRAIGDVKKTEEIMPSGDWEPIEYPKIVRYGDNHPARVLKQMYPEIRAHYTDIHRKYNDLLKLHTSVYTEYAKMFKRFNALLLVAKNVRKKIPRTIVPDVKKKKKMGDSYYFRILKQKSTLKKAIKEHMEAKLWTLRYEDMPASLTVQLLYERFLKDEGISDEFYKVLYIINIYRYCLATDIEWWGVSGRAFRANIKNMIAMGYVEVNTMGRSRPSYTTTPSGKRYLSKLKTYSDNFYKDLLNTSETGLKSDSFGIKVFAYSKYGRDKFRKFNGGAESLPQEPTEAG